MSRIDCNHLNISQKFSGNSTVSQHMQETQFLNKNIQFYQRRRHKLLRALAEGECVDQRESSNPRQQLVALFETAANKENQISQLDYFIKHELNCSLDCYSQALMQIIWNLFDHRDGSVIAFVMYRLCRRQPALFWKCFARVSENLESTLQGKQINLPDRQANKQIHLQILIFYTDLYLYGFPFTVQDFHNKIFPQFKSHPIDLIIKYQQIFASSIFFSSKLQKTFAACFNQWLEHEKIKIVQIYERLTAVGTHLQQLIINAQENQAESANYQLQLQHFQTQLYHLMNAAQQLDWSFDGSLYKLKTIFNLKKQCKTFKTNFQISPYERALYLKHRREQVELKPLKKHEMLRIQQSDAFINQLKLCTDLNQCINLTGYFLQQMNLQSNREYLIETIINDCHSYNNLSYLLKVVFQIAQAEPTLTDYCSSKAKKICASSRMNPKYQRLLCEMAKYRLIDENILLEYCQKILKNENSQTTKQIEFILENMGCITYYRSLPTHIRINALFEKLELIIKTRLTHFSVQHLYQLKGLINYLRNHKNSNSSAETREIAKIQIKSEQNYNFLLKKMEKMAKEDQISKIIDQLTCGIEQEQYLTSYYYASLLKDLDSPHIQKKMHEETHKIIISSLVELNAQKAVRWSRFLGELYSYQCINRKNLLEDFKQIFQKSNSQMLVAVGLKCICSSLQTSKSYLKMTNFKRERQIVLMLLELKCVYVRYKKHLEYALICEVEEIIEFFNPQIMAVLDTQSDIQQFMSLCSRFLQNTSHTVSHYISQLVSGTKMQNLRFTDEVVSQVKPKYKQKETSVYRQKETEQRQERKWVQKPLKFVQKLENNEEVKAVVGDLQENSKESSVTVETAEGNTATKKIRVIGRSKKDNKLKTVTCIFGQPAPQT